LGVSIGQSYDSAEEALSAVRRIVQWRVANIADVNLEAKPTLTINFKLDLKQLPRPMQIGAIGQSDWNISFSKTQRLELTP
jgi:site-specific recombinase XerC